MFNSLFFLFVIFTLTFHVSSKMFIVGNVKKFNNSTFKSNKETPLYKKTVSVMVHCDKKTDIKLSLFGGRHKCVCRYPELFRYNATGQCNVPGPGVCEHGQLDVDSLALPKCKKCPNNSVSVRINGIPKCEPINFNESRSVSGSGMISVSNLMINQDFKNKLANKDSLKNPCNFDALSGLYTGYGETKVSANGIYYCVTNNWRAITIRSDDDYLKGNGGNYSNGIIVVSDSDAENTVVEWKSENEYTVGYRYKVSKLYKHVVDKFNLSKYNYVNIFNSQTPADGNGLSYPFNSILNFSETATVDNPKPAPDNFMFHYVSVTGERVPLISCDKLGTPDVDVKFYENGEYERYLFDNKRDSLRIRGYVVCTRLKTEPGQLNFIPNTLHSKFTGVVSITADGIINPVWYGTPQQLEKYRKLYFNL